MRDRKERGRRGRISAAFVAVALLFALTVSGCTGSGAGSGSELSGRVKIDGSSTVYPITEAVSEEFQNENRRVMVTVGLSGTGGGFKKFTTGETDISNASRRIKPEEIEQAKENGIEYVELRIASDGLSVAINPANKFAREMTVAELKKIWNRGSKVKTWKDVRPAWPNRKIKLFGPGTDSGTFDFFTEAINGEEDVSRADYTASEDDNTLVQGVSGEKDALAYFGFAYFIENKDRVNVVAVDGVKPSLKSIRSGKYKPLSRPLFIYVNKESLKKPQVKAYIKFYLRTAGELTEEVGYVPLSDEEYQAELGKL